MAEARRRQAIAAHLIERLCGDGLPLRRVDRVHVQADPGNDAAVALRDKLRMHEAVLHLDIPLP